VTTTSDRPRHKVDPTDGQQTWRNSLTHAAALCGLSGATVAVVLQDLTVLLPFVILIPVAAAVVHALSRAPEKLVRGLAVALVVGGLAAVVYGGFVSDDGTLQALGVLGGSATAAAGTGSACCGLAARRGLLSPRRPHEGAAQVIRRRPPPA
jgi:hypothetical protein